MCLVAITTEDLYITLRRCCRPLLDSAACPRGLLSHALHSSVCGCPDRALRLNLAVCRRLIGLWFEFGMELVSRCVAAYSRCPGQFSYQDSAGVSATSKVKNSHRVATIAAVSSMGHPPASEDSNHSTSAATVSRASAFTAITKWSHRAVADLISPFQGSPSISNAT